MNFLTNQNDPSIIRMLGRAVAAVALFAVSSLALAQQTLAPLSISFGNVPLTLPVTQTGTFSNNSTFQAVTITGLSTSDARFVAVGSGGAPCSVGAVLTFGASCTYALTFTPTGTGSYNNTTSVAYNLVAAAQTPLTQASNGTGFIPPASALPTGLSFGNLPITLANSQSFTFSNDSNTTLFPTPYTLTSFTTTGLGYTAVGSGTTPCAVGLVIPPAGSCGATVTFQIAVTGSSGGTTTIGYQAGLGTNPIYTTTIGSSGGGALQPSTLSPAGLAFGNVVVGVPAILSATFTNTSNLTTFPSTVTVRYR